MPVNTNHLLANEALGPDQALMSVSGRYTFVYQGDGNLVLYDNSSDQLRRALWSSGTAGQAVGTCIMQGDGNLVIYAPNNVPLWASGTMVANSRLIVQDDGNVEIYTPTNAATWATNTAQPMGPIAAWQLSQSGLGNVHVYPSQFGYAGGLVAAGFGDDDNATSL